MYNMLKWVNLLLINLLYFFNKFLGHYILNFFIRKKLKKFSSKYLDVETYINNGFYIENVHLDNLNINFIESINCNFYNFLYDKCFLHIINNLSIIFNNNSNIKYQYNLDKKNIKFINIEVIINNGVNMMKKIINYLLLNHKLDIKI